MRNITDRLESDGPASGLGGETGRCPSGSAVEDTRGPAPQSGGLLVLRSGPVPTKGFLKAVVAFPSMARRYGGDDVRNCRDRLLRIWDVLEIVGLSDKTIYRHMKEGLFPQSVRTGPNSVAWRESDIMAWIAGLPPANEDSADAR